MTTHILLVEDNQGDINLVTAFCAEAAPHLRFTVVGSGSACLAALNADPTPPFAAIVLDYHLPDMDGLMLLRQVVASGYPAPVIMITARNDVETAVEVMKAGAMDYLVKSTEYWEYLPRAIESAIAHDRLTRENRRLQQELSTYTVELEHTLQKARRERDRLQTVLDQLPEGVVIVEGARGRIVAANRAAERLWGHPFIQGVDISEYNRLENLDGTPRRPEETTIARVLHTGNPVLGAQSVIVQPDGQRIVILTNAAPLRDDQGNVSGVVAVFQDISELKRLEQVQDEILSIASHELKNPLTAIVGYSSLLMRSPTVTQDPQTRRAAETIRQESQKMHRFIERLLDFSRVELGRMKLQPAPFDLVALLQTVVEEQQATAPNHGLSLHAEQAKLVVHGDGIRLKQVLVTLVSTAITSTPEGGTVWISLRVYTDRPLPACVCSGTPVGSGPFACVGVHHQGAGISPEEQRQLFRPFSGVHTATQIIEDHRLDWYISAEVMRLHGGVLCVESTPGQGSTFHLILPLADAQ